VKYKRGIKSRLIMIFSFQALAIWSIFSSKLGSKVVVAFMKEAKREQESSM